VHDYGLRSADFGLRNELIADFGIRQAMASGSASLRGVSSPLLARGMKGVELSKAGY